MTLFAAWAIHDLEELIAFPVTTSRLAEETGADWLRISARQSAVAIGLMGAVVATACVRGAVTNGRSRFYRRTLAGLDLHVWSHVAASVVLRRYTAGVLTAVPFMLPGARFAERELAATGHALSHADRAVGAPMMVVAALACHGVARAWVQ
ncbi:HXXEE domain-containing protein [Brevibacterium casei]|uniref:HXXEE domain-containing protein n=1 Tax=Brevibacterium casei TaxID=33889 RepID=UPI0013C2E664|nr:HXXEE domain-containing protein [Brevibacterium casei]MCT1765756.1 HXXEE domain-containing protein [Brevibacterium casei]